MKVPMNDTLRQLLRQASRLTQSGRLNEATQTLQRALGGLPAAPVFTPTAAFAAPPARTDAGAFTSGTHTQSAQARGFKLYLPPDAAGRPLPLVVMLHGCTQSPDDFAAGTGMNARAAEQGFCVLYPAQSQEANPSRCWNWFQPGDQRRGSGEPAVIAGMTQMVLKQHGLDPRRVYVAGLSAGGAMADIVATAYPELFAAVGVHSGLPRGAAANLVEALAAMKHGADAVRRSGERSAVPTIVFHGDQDRTVHARNGERLIAALEDLVGSTAPRVEQGVSAMGRRYTRSVHLDGAGRSAAEHWVLHGAGHAWSGGRPEGSYTDPKGPDATREMLRFFFEHPHAGPR